MEFNALFTTGHVGRGLVDAKRMPSRKEIMWILQFICALLRDERVKSKIPQRTSTIPSQMDQKGKEKVCKRKWLIESPGSKQTHISNYII